MVGHMTNQSAERLDRVRSAFLEWQVDGLLVTNLINCAWLSGFTGTAASLLITDNVAKLATDSRYWEQAAQQAPDYDLFKYKRQPQDTAKFIQSAGVRTIGIESNHVTIQQAEELETIEGINWRHLIQPLEPLRREKSEEEIASIRAAAAITDSAMAQLPNLVRPGISERELAWLLERQMREAGASSMAFPPIVAFGPNSARPHHSPGDRRLQLGKIVLVDMGAKLNGYNSDLTRTFFFDEPPDDLFTDIFSTVLTAQTEAIAGIRSGINTQEAHSLAEHVISNAGYAEKFGHGLGHGVGLEIHEDPFLSATRPPQILSHNEVITIEPGIYLSGWGGVRIEDLIVLGEEGTYSLSKAAKEPILTVH